MRVSPFHPLVLLAVSVLLPLGCYHLGSWYHARNALQASPARSSAPIASPKAEHPTEALRPCQEAR